MSDKQSNTNITPPIKSVGGGKLVELDLMKFYGILLVVLGHVAFCYTDAGAVKPAIASDVMITLKNIIYAFHMPMFVFASGCVYAYQMEIKKRKQILWQLATNKFKRLMIPYYVFAFLWVLPTMCILHLRQPIPYAKELLVGFDPRHLWYVMMLFGAFILFYCLRWACVKCKMSILSVFFVAVVLYFLPHVISMPSFVNYLQIHSLLAYFLWFTLGYFFVVHKKYAKFITIPAMAIIALSLFVALPNVMGVVETASAITGIALFYILSSYTTFLARFGWYQIISRNSFGIYLFHAMIIYMLEYVFSSYSVNPIILSLLVFTISLVLSVILTECVRRIKLGVIIGE